MTIVVRILAAFLFLFGLLTIAAYAEASHRDGPCSDVHWKKRGRRGVVEVIRCAARRVGVPGGPRKMLAVGRCESGLRRWATNGPYKSILQQDENYWPIRAASYGFRGAGIFNIRAHAYVSARMARDDGTWAEDWPYCGSAA